MEGASTAPSMAVVVREGEADSDEGDNRYVRRGQRRWGAGEKKLGKGAEEEGEGKEKGKP